MNQSNKLFEKVTAQDSSADNATLNANRTEKLLLLMEQNRLLWPFNALIGLMLLVTLWRPGLFVNLTLWFAGLIFLQITKHLYLRHGDLLTVNNRTKAWPPVFTVLLLTESIWGLGILATALEASPDERLAIFLFLLIIAYIQSFFYASITPLIITILPITIIPMAIALDIDQHEFFHFATLTSLVFLVFAYKSSQVLSRQYSQRLDLSEQLIKQTQQLRIANTKAKDALNARSHFISVLSHEIRTPLNAVIAMSDMLKNTNINSDQKEYIGTLNLAGDQLMGLVNNILDFSKIDDGQLELELAPFNIKTLSERLHKLLSRNALQKNLNFYITYNPLVHETWVGDEQRISQILINLLSNAIKNTLQGYVALRIDPMEAEQAGLCITVEDSGKGIDKAHLDTIFGAFTQVGDSRNDATAGVGLGLAISKLLVEKMNGSIVTRSRLGHGSQFKVLLPLEPSTTSQLETANEIKQAINENLSERQILIAEDSELNQMVLEAYLGSSGAVLTFVEDGDSAVKYAMLGNFDVILLDIQMPIMGGIEAIENIRELEKQNRSKAVSIIVQSADNRADTRKKAIAAGANDFLSKPYSRHGLLEIINKYIARPERITSTRSAPPSSSDIESKTLDKLFNEFLRQTNVDLSKALRALDMHDYERAATLAHTIKGHCGIFKRPDLQSIAKELEAACGEKNMELAIDLIIIIHNHVDRRTETHRRGIKSLRNNNQEETDV